MSDTPSYIGLDQHRGVGERPQRIVGFLGASQSRKSTLMRKVVRETSRRDRRLAFFVWDSGSVSGQWCEGQLDPETRVWRSAPAAFPPMSCHIYRTIEDARSAISTVQDLASKRYHVFSGSIDFEDFMDFCLEVGGVVAVVDEIDLVSSKQSLPPQLNKIINAGRHIDGRLGMGVSLIWAARRMQKVHNDLLSGTVAAGSVFIKRTSLKKDRDLLATELDELPPELRSMPVDKFLRFDQGAKFEGPVGESLYIEGLTPIDTTRILQEMEASHQSDIASPPQPSSTEGEKPEPIAEQPDSPEPET